MCFLLSDDHKRYSFLFKKLRDQENVGRNEYTVTNTSAMYLLIRIVGGIHKNQQSTYENRGVRGGRQQKWHTGHTLISNIIEAFRESLKKIQH